MAFAVLSGLVLSLAAPLISRWLRGAAAWVLALLPLGLTAYFAHLAAGLNQGEIARESVSFVPVLGLSLSFRGDGLGLLFALLVSAVAVPVVVFSGGYLKDDPRRGSFFAYLLAFMAAMLGLVLSDDLIVLYAFWELTSVASYFLIAFGFTEPESRDAAWRALLVTSGGGLCLLAGFLLLGAAGGTLSVSELLTRGDAVREHRLYLPALACIGVGAAAKSAQVPLHFWLPSAMTAPAPASAYLHSATMVKAGVYLLARLSPVLGATAAFRGGALAVGAASAVLGAIFALRETDMKRILAYSTISALGTMVALLGWGTPEAVLAAMVYVVAHAAYKGSLFLVTGSIDHAAGTRDVRDLSGLRRAMPLTAVAAAIAGLSMAGVPPLLGFAAKELTLAALLSSPALLAVAVVAGLVNVVLACVTTVGPFLSGTMAPREEGGPREPREVSAGMWGGSLVLALGGVGLGLLSRPLGERLLLPATAAVAGRLPERPHLSPIHGLSLFHEDGSLHVVLVLGLGMLAVGGVLYLLAGRLRVAAARIPRLPGGGMSGLYEAGLAGLFRGAGAHTRVIQDGKLRHYMLATIAVSILAVGGALAAAPGPIVREASGAVRSYEGVLAAVVIAAAVVVAAARPLLLSITAMGVVGYGVALFFALFGAPDLAMTQLATETLTILLLVLVLYRMPPVVPRSSRAVRARDAALALAGGGLMGLLVRMVESEPGASRLTPYFAENSAGRGHGRNVVNVLLVDFRALDTLGEITVLAVAALGLRALIKLSPGARA
ncbi:MAG: hydrogen gas-evolving membrane-bound hydrogenase subunit E [Polyangiaceae bacterium]